MVLITFITALYFHKMFTASIRNCQEVPSGLVFKESAMPQMWLRFELWPGKFYILQVRQKNKFPVPNTPHAPLAT